MLNRSFRVVPVLALVLAAACTSGESADAPEGSAVSRDSATPTPTAMTLAGGTSIQASLNTTISSNGGQAGDLFSATVAGDVLDANGRVAIPSGARIRGTIVEVTPAPNDHSTGVLTLAISSVTVAGQDYSMDASIDSLMTYHEGRGLERADVIRVAGGAVVGSVIGKAVGGDSKGALIGGIIGAAAGAATSSLVKDQDIVLPAGARLMLSLREPLRIEGR